MRNSAAILTRGRAMLYPNTCDVLRSGGTVAARTTPAAVHSGLSCSNFHEMGHDEAERAGLATITRPIHAYVKLPLNGVIQEEDVVESNSKEYTVRKASLWPHQDPVHYELIMEYKRP